MSFPSAPDPYATAAAQGAENRSTAQFSTVLNNPNENTPYGSTSWDKNNYTFQDAQGNPYQVERPTRTVELAPAEERKLKKSNRLQNSLLTTANEQMDRVRETLSKPIDTSSAPQMITEIAQPKFEGRVDTPDLIETVRASPNLMTKMRADALPDLQTSYAPEDGFSEDRRRVEEALMSRLTPQYERDRAALETQLVNQGFTRGSDAFENAMDEARRSETDARVQTILAGGQEQSRLLGEARSAAEFENIAGQQGFDNDMARRNYLNATRQQAFGNDMARQAYMNATMQQGYQNDLSQMEAANQAKQMRQNAQLQAASFQNDARSNAIQEIYAERNQPLNEIGAAISGGQVNNPQFMSMFRQGVEPAPVADSVYRSYEAESANAANMLGGFTSLLTAPFSMFSFSDERLKENIKPVGETDGGTPLYSWNYKGDPETRIGPIAQEVAQTQPDAVGVHKTGLLGVDYGKLH